MKFLSMFLGLTLVLRMISPASLSAQSDAAYRQIINNTLAHETVIPAQVTPDGMKLRVTDMFSERSSGLTVTDWGVAELRSITSIYVSECAWKDQAVPCVRVDAPFRRYNEETSQFTEAESDDRIVLSRGSNYAGSIVKALGQLARSAGATPLLDSPTQTELARDTADTSKALNTFSVQQQPALPSTASTRPTPAVASVKVDLNAALPKAASLPAPSTDLIKRMRKGEHDIGPVGHLSTDDAISACSQGVSVKGVGATDACNFLTWDAEYAVMPLAHCDSEGKPKVACEAEQFAKQAFARGCTLGNAFACAKYAERIWNRPDAGPALQSLAERIWVAGPCAAAKVCRDIEAQHDNGQNPYLNDSQKEMMVSSLVVARQKNAELQTVMNSSRAEQQQRSETCPFCTVVDAIAPLTANANPNAIQNMTNQQLSNIQTRQAQIQAAQATTRAQQAKATSTQVAKSVSDVPVPDSGKAPAANTYSSAIATSINTLCPASGFIPGVMTHPSPDVALGVQCKPGSVIYINGVPQFDTTGTGLGAVTRSGAGGGTNGGGNGGSSVSSTDGPPEVGCIQLSSDPTNTYPVFHNTCSFAVTYFWTPFTTPPGGYAQQNGILQPGETQKGEETAVGGYRVYACQTNYLVRGPDGSPITGVVNGYRCVKP